MCKIVSPFSASVPAGIVLMKEKVEFNHFVLLSGTQMIE